MKYQFINKRTDNPVSKWLNFLQVSSSGYYAYIKRTEEVEVKEQKRKYVCIVKDIFTGVILGSSTAETMKKELVIQAFLNAQARHRFNKGMLFHSDRGSQYTSKGFMETVHSFGVVQSFSRVGMPGDN